MLLWIHLALTLLYPTHMWVGGRDSFYDVCVRDFPLEVTDGGKLMCGTVIIHSSIQISSCYVQARAQMMVGLVVSSMSKLPIVRI